MAQWTKLLHKPDSRTAAQPTCPGSMWKQKQRADFTKLTSDLHMCATTRVLACPQNEMKTPTEKEKEEEKGEGRYFPVMKILYK